MKAGDWIQHKERQDEIYRIEGIELTGEDLHPILYLSQWITVSPAKGQAPIQFTERPDAYTVLEGGTAVGFTPIVGTFHQEKGPTWAALRHE